MQYKYLKSGQKRPTSTLGLASFLLRLQTTIVITRDAVTQITLIKESMTENLIRNRCIEAGYCLGDHTSFCPSTYDGQPALTEKTSDSNVSQRSGSLGSRNGMCSAGCHRRKCHHHASNMRWAFFGPCTRGGAPPLVGRLAPPTVALWYRADSMYGIRL